jgi:hypothetical protein
MYRQSPWAFSCAELLASRFPLGKLFNCPLSRASHQSAGRFYLGLRLIKMDCMSNQPKPRLWLIKWGGTELAMLGRWPDKEIAKLTCRAVADVAKKRESLGIVAPTTF